MGAMAPREEAGWLENKLVSLPSVLGAICSEPSPYQAPLEPARASGGMAGAGAAGRFTYNQSWGSKTEPPPPCSPPLPPATPGMVPQQKQKEHEGMARGAGKFWELVNFPVITKGWAPSGLEGTSRLPQGLWFRRA